MKGSSQLVLLSGLLVLAILALTACTHVPETKYEWLSMFFDGVPEPGTENSVLNAQTGPVNQGIQGAVPDSTPAVITLAVHKPFAERRCDACHQSMFSNKLTTSPEELCFQCHFSGNLRNTLTHAPVLSGDCWTCHDPHKSAHPYLLKDTASATCYQCHGKEEIRALHQETDKPELLDTCTQCHDPHGNQHPAFLIKDPVHNGIR